MIEENLIYCDPNAFIKKEKPKENKCDCKHIEQVNISQPYDLYPKHYDNNFKCEKDINENHKPPQNNFDFSKLLSLMQGDKNINSLLPQLISNFGGNKDLSMLLNLFSKPQKKEVKMVENFEADTISKYPRVK
ncbi:MAG: hypothetical protein IJX26_00390 [Clostridia bacterium]|nr:hypothetical protein [Clostridia bacterium]